MSWSADNETRSVAPVLHAVLPYRQVLHGNILPTLFSNSTQPAVQFWYVTALATYS